MKTVMIDSTRGNLLQAFADLLGEHQLARHAQEGLTYPGHEKAAQVRTHFGKKFARVDVGASGKYMVDLDTLEIFGVKGYGVVHRGHCYGTLNTIHAWNWGGYTAVPLKLAAA